MKCICLTFLGYAKTLGPPCLLKWNCQQHGPCSVDTTKPVEELYVPGSENDAA